MLHKDRRKTRRLPIRLDVDLRPVTVNRSTTEQGQIVKASISNVGPSGVLVDLPSEYPAGTRFWVRTNLNGKRVEFYAMVRHVSLSIMHRTAVYSHGLQITAALAEVMDGFELLMRRYLNGEIKAGEDVAADINGHPPHNGNDSGQGGASLAN